MRREPQDPRPDAYAIVEREGLAYARERVPGEEPLPYWFEGAAYVFTSAQIDRLERVTEELHGMALAATRAMAHDPEMLTRLGVPRVVWESLRRSLDADWSLYGRFDLAWDGESEPKLLEYNADTPAGLVEAAVTQWHWVEAVKPDRDQWNLLHERLVQAWREHVAPEELVHLAAGRNEPVEDWNTVAYVADTVAEAGARPVTIAVEDIGLSRPSGRFVGLEGEEIRHCFAMYPWDWMLREEFGVAAVGSAVHWLEPVWKVLTGSKALLPVLWQMYPDHPNLLPAAWSARRVGKDHVVKPVHGWEGAGVQVVLGGEPAESAAPRHTAGQPVVYQAYRDLAIPGGFRPVLGTWVVNGHAAGLGIRETDPGRLVTDTRARFVPHWIDAPRSTDADVAGWLAD